MKEKSWFELRSVGNLWVLKISYVALALIPFLTKYNSVSELLGLDVWLLGVIYFANLFLALANLIYDIACPVVVRRFASPNDFYMQMLEIRNLSLKLYPADRFNASYKHCEQKYVSDSNSKPTIRNVCFACYATAGILFFLFFANRSLVVIQALFWI